MTRRFYPPGALPLDYLVEVGEGHVPKHRVLVTPGLHDASIPIGTLGDISLIPGVVRLETPGGVGLEVVSSSASDAAAGTGIQSVDIHYLDSNYISQTETVVLNGTTPVLTVSTDIYEVQWMHARTLGSSFVAAGNISLRGIGAGTTYEYIQAGGNQSLTCRYTVPAGKKAVLLNWHCSGMKKRIDFFLRATCEREDRTLLPGIFLFQDAESCENSNSGLLDGKGLLFPAKSTIKVSAKAASTGGEAAASFTILLIDD